MIYQKKSRWFELKHRQGRNATTVTEMLRYRSLLFKRDCLLVSTAYPLCKTYWCGTYRLEC